MSWTSAARALAIVGLAGAALVAAEPVALARDKPVTEVEAPPPPPPPPGPVALPQRTLADAAAYQAYLERVQATSPAFTSGASVALALRNATAFEPHALIRGAVAYAAVAALQDQTFVSEVRAAGNTPENRRLMVGYLMADPGYALLFKGSDGAAGLAREALGSGGLKLLAAGKLVKQSAYDIQHQAWSKIEVVDRGGRLKAVEVEGTSPLPEAADHIDALQRAAAGGTPLPITAGPARPPYTPLVARAVQIAAIAALGEANDGTYDQLSILAADEGTNTCLHMAKLNLYQCLAVAKPNYEDIFCTGQHGMADTGSCIAHNAGVAMPPDAPGPAAMTRKPTGAEAG
ncbi:MAG TPA: hypothetical protein VG166_06630 [Caulobacteraceae bacterium]|nr:hypothetical protein [Caulobacteraceae bacterium]